MSNQITNHYFRLFERSNRDSLEELSKYTYINSKLTSLDWLFISPLFFQGYELKGILTAVENAVEPKEKILAIIANKFYNLPVTASFVEGYCIRSKFIQPFLFSIEHSIVLTFQKDYEGAIKTLIPIIEGIIRKYLIEEKGAVMQYIQFEKIRKSFDLLYEDIILKCAQDLKSCKSENNEPLLFTDEQIDLLLSQDKEYYAIWFSFVTDFINRSFYLKTNGIPLTNEVNRHSILHELGNVFEYNFENYIKIYFLLQFMTWAFLKREGKSQLNQIGSFRYFEKVMAYKSIITIAKRAEYDKHILYKGLDNYNDNLLKKEFPPPVVVILPKKQIVKHKVFKTISKYLWYKGINTGYSNLQD